MKLTACWALHGPGHASHLYTDEDEPAEKSLCGTLRGKAAPAVTCTSCLHRFQTDTPDGKRIARRAAAAAIHQHVQQAVAGYAPAFADAAELLKAMTHTPNSHGHDNHPPEVTL